MRGARLAVLVLVLVLEALAGGGGCFSPQQPACAFSCVVDHECPKGYTCGGDGLCHRADGVGQCLLDPAEGGTGPSDSGVDGNAPGS